MELGKADREPAAHKEREQEIIGVTRAGGARKRPSIAAALVAIFSIKKTEAQKGERVYMGLVQPRVIISSTPAPAPASAARDERRQRSVMPNLKTLFMTQEGKGNGEETQGNERKRRSLFGSPFWWLKADVESPKGAKEGVEESLVGMKWEKREGLEVEVKKLARRSTWGSEAPPAYESLLEEDQQHEGDSHSD